MRWRGDRRGDGTGPRGPRELPRHGRIEDPTSAPGVAGVEDNHGTTGRERRHGGGELVDPESGPAGVREPGVGREEEQFGAGGAENRGSRDWRHRPSPCRRAGYSDARAWNPSQNAPALTSPARTETWS